MRFYRTFLALFLAMMLFSCAAEKRPNTPLETLKAYTQAIKKKDTATMKTLLSKGSIKMAQDEAKEQGTRLDDVIQKETLFSQEQKTVEFRNEKVEGDNATIEMKNSYGTWDIVPFVKEDGEWKIAKERYADELMKQVDEDTRRQEEQINQSRNPQ